LFFFESNRNDDLIKRCL